MLPRKCIQKNEEGNTDLLLTLLCFFLLSCETASKSPFTSAAHKCKCFTAAVATLQCLKVTKNVSLSEEARIARNVKYVKGHFFERFLNKVIVKGCNPYHHNPKNGLCFYSKIFLFFAWRVGTWSRATRRRGHNSDLVVAHADGLRQLEYFNTRPEKDQWSTLASLPDLCGVDGVAIAGHRTKVLSLFFMFFKLLKKTKNWRPSDIFSFTISNVVALRVYFYTCAMYVLWWELRWYFQFLFDVVKSP